MKNYRIVRVADLGYDYLRDSLNHKFSTSEISYSEQLTHIFRSGFGYGDSFARAMKKIGHDAYELITDLDVLQKTWANENGIDINKAPTRWHIFYKQLQLIKPDIVYIQGISCVPCTIRQQIKTQCPSVKLVIGYTGSVIFFNQLQDLDLICASPPMMQQFYADKGLKTKLLYHWFDEAILKALQPSASVENLTFIGSSGYGNTYGIHNNRYWMLVDLLKTTDMKAWIHDITADYDQSKSISSSTLLKYLRHIDTKTLEKVITTQVLPNNEIRSKINLMIKQILLARSKFCDSNDMDRHSLYIWGAGGVAKQILADLGDESRQITGLIDSNINMEGTYVAGKKIYSPRQLEAIQKGPTIPIILIGSCFQNEIADVLDKMGLRENEHYFSYEKTLSAIKHYIGANCAAHGKNNLLINFLSNYSQGDDVAVLPLPWIIPEKCRPPLFGTPMYQQLKNSKVTAHISGNFFLYRHACAIRLFQATGVGTCLITDHASNLSHLFDQDREVVTYASLDECKEKINYLITHDKERENIACAGQKRTLKDHTAYNRCLELDSTIQELLA